MNNLQDYIVVLKNVVGKDLREKIIKQYENSDLWIKSITEDNRQNYRNCSHVPISHLNDDQSKVIDNEIFSIVKICIIEYQNKFKGLIISSDTGYELLRYEKNGFYKEHVDESSVSHRTVSCSLLLNDNFNGGEFAFFDGNLKYNLNAGDAIMFPSNFMYPHQILPVKKGVRYSIISWLI